MAIVVAHQLPKLLEPSQLEVPTILMGHPVVLSQMSLLPFSQMFAAVVKGGKAKKNSPETDFAEGAVRVVVGS